MVDTDAEVEKRVSYQERRSEAEAFLSKSGFTPEQVTEALAMADLAQRIYEEAEQSERVRQGEVELRGSHFRIKDSGNPRAWSGEKILTWIDEIDLGSYPDQGPNAVVAAVRDEIRYTLLFCGLNSRLD